MPTFIRVRDPKTKHEFDVPVTSPLLRQGQVEPIKASRYPPSPVARRPKHYIKPAGRSASREPVASSETAGKATTSKES